MKRAHVEYFVKTVCAVRNVPVLVSSFVGLSS
jgi:hypothetical protein